MGGKKLKPREAREIGLAGLLFLWALHFLGGCAAIYTAHGVYYRVHENDTIEGIAKKYKVEVQDLAEINNIESTGQLKVGRSLYIPGVTPNSFAAIIGHEKRLAEKAPKHEKKKKRGEVAANISPTVIEVDHDRFHWPIQGGISSGFGIRHGRRHDGLDIRAKVGTPVKVAADGEVVFSKRMRGYGNLVLVKHEGDFFTVYAHNSANLVKQGRKVKSGDVIAKVGRTGRASGPHLHFEVREGAKARNPLFFLPKTAFALKEKEGDSDVGGPEEENP